MKIKTRTTLEINTREAEILIDRLMCEIKYSDDIKLDESVELLKAAYEAMNQIAKIKELLK